MLEYLYTSLNENEPEDFDRILNTHFPDELSYIIMSYVFEVEDISRYKPIKRTVNPFYNIYIFSVFLTPYDYNILSNNEIELININTQELSFFLHNINSETINKIKNISETTERTTEQIIPWLKNVLFYKQLNFENFKRLVMYCNKFNDNRVVISYEGIVRFDEGCWIFKVLKLGTEHLNIIMKMPSAIY
jgi:hypothetical protein